MAEVQVVELAEYRPALRDHPFQTATDGPACAGLVGSFREAAARCEVGVVETSPGGAALHVTQNLRCEEITEAGRGRHGVLQVGLVAEARKGRVPVALRIVAEIRHPLETDQPV